MKIDRKPLGWRLDNMSNSENLKFREVRRNAWIAGRSYVQATEQIAGIELKLAWMRRPFRSSMLIYSFLFLLLVVSAEKNWGNLADVTKILLGLALVASALLSLGYVMLNSFDLLLAYEKAFRRKTATLTHWSALTQGLNITPYLEFLEFGNPLDFGPGRKELDHRLITEVTGRSDEVCTEE
jgi:hypothetical protein